jgi:hypothetical protein
MTVLQYSDYPDCFKASYVCQMCCIIQCSTYKAASPFVGVSNGRDAAELPLSLTMLRLVVCSAALCGFVHGFAVPAGAGRTSNSFLARNQQHPASRVILNAAPPKQQTEQELRFKVC